VTTSPFAIPDQLARAALGFRDGMGREWLARLPDLVAEYASRWSLTLGEPFAYPSLSFVAPGVNRDGEHAVLKIGFLLDELRTEIGALRLYDGRGAVRLIDADAEQGVLLLERLEPGSGLVEVESDEEATAIAAAAMLRLWRPVPSDNAFPTVAHWLRGLASLRERFDGGTGPLPAQVVEQAESLSVDLLASTDQPVLLHGDLQQFNVLRAEREPWLVIDPKGVVGDAAYEPTAFLCNEWERAADPLALLTRRVDQFAAELGLNRERIRSWAIVHAALSSWWHIEDSGACPPEQIRYMELVSRIR
jgi:streptomycin 6-kinase